MAVKQPKVTSVTHQCGNCGNLVQANRGEIVSCPDCGSAVR